MNDFWEGFREGFDMAFIPLAILALIIGLFWSEPAPAQEHFHPPAHADLHHQFYQTWLRPDMRQLNKQRWYSCCDNMDCAPARFKHEKGQLLGQKMGVADNTWYVIPEQLLESNQEDPRESPDGRGHLCARLNAFNGHPQVFCAVLGAGI